MRNQSRPDCRVLSDIELVQLVYSDPEALAAFVEALLIMKSGGEAQITYSDEDGYRVEAAMNSIIN